MFFPDDSSLAVPEDMRYLSSGDVENDENF